MNLLLGQPRPVRRRRPHIFLAQRRVMLDDLGRREPGGERVKDHGHQDPGALDARLPVADGRIDRDPLEELVLAEDRQGRTDSRDVIVYRLSSNPATVVVTGRRAWPRRTPGG